MLSAHRVDAQVVINEIMYDLEGSDTDREWIEVLNTSGSDIDLSAWKFYENTTNHGLTPFQGGSVLSSGEYAVIVDDPTMFLSDWPDFADIIFDSSFSLSNTGETIAINDDTLTVVDQMTYSSNDGAAGDGNSLQESGGSWIAALPTPGAVNDSGSSPPPQNDDDDGGSSSGSTQQQQTPLDNEEPSISAEILTKTTAVAGVETQFDSLVLGFSGETLKKGKYFWNFGDLITKEDDEGGKLKHTYRYAGDYVVILDYYRNSYALEPDASDRTVIKVIPANVEISSVGEGEDIFVELFNAGKYEMDLSKWILQIENKRFSIPKNTIILANKKLIFPSDITGFTNEDRGNLKLLFPSGETAFTYTTQEPELVVELVQEPEKEPPKIVYAPDQAKVFAVNTETPEPKEENLAMAPTPESTSEPFPDSVPMEALQVAAIGSLSALSSQAGQASQSQKNKDSNKLYGWIFALIGLIIVSTSAVFLLQKEKSPRSLADDIEILN